MFKVNNRLQSGTNVVMDTVINSAPNADISKKHENRFFLIKVRLLYLAFKFSSCVLKYTQGLKSEVCKNLGKKPGFDGKVTCCYFCIPS